MLKKKADKEKHRRYIVRKRMWKIVKNGKNV